MKISTRAGRRLAVMGAIVAVATGGSGIALAAGATSASTTIHACANRSTGALRLASHCKHTEKSVSWAQTGPRGPSDAYYYSSTGGPAVTLLAGVDTKVASLPLPAGDYVIDAALSIAGASAAGRMDCEGNWPAGATGATSFPDEVFPAAPPGLAGIDGPGVTVVAEGKLAHPGTFTLTCDSGVNAFANYVNVTAVQVASLHKVS